jgi:hypothetical protein
LQERAGEVDVHDLRCYLLPTVWLSQRVRCAPAGVADESYPLKMALSRYLSNISISVTGNFRLRHELNLTTLQLSRIVGCEMKRLHTDGAITKEGQTTMKAKTKAAAKKKAPAKKPAAKKKKK